MGLPESCQPQQLALFVIVDLSMEFLAMLTGYGTILYGGNIARILGNCLDD